MNKELLKEIKKTMEARGAIHAIYGIRKWNGDLEMVEKASDVDYHYTEYNFDEEVAYLQKVRGATMIYAIHAR